MRTLSLLSLVAWIIGASPSAQSAPIAAGLEDLDGKAVVMDSQANRVLVVFWATWCPSCRSEFTSDLPALARLPGVEVLTVNTDSDRERAKDFVGREKLPFRVYRDPSKGLRKALQVASVPHWAVYGRKDKADWQLIASQGAFDLAAVKRSLTQN